MPWKLLTAALGDDANLAGRRTAVLGAVVGGQNLDFLHRVDVGRADGRTVGTGSNADRAVKRDQVVLRAAAVDVQTAGGEIEAELGQRPPLTPGFNSARNTGLRPFNGVSAISFVVTTRPSVADSDWIDGASATTFTVSVVAPTAIVDIDCRRDAGVELVIGFLVLLKARALPP